MTLKKGYDSRQKKYNGNLNGMCYYLHLKLHVEIKEEQKYSFQTSLDGVEKVV